MPSIIVLAKLSDFADLENSIFLFGNRIEYVVRRAPDF